MSEIVAERDQIRAEHAVATRRLEQKIAALEASKADLMGQAGRQATRIVTVENELAEAPQPRRGLGGGARERHAGRAGSAGRTRGRDAIAARYARRCGTAAQPAAWHRGRACGGPGRGRAAASRRDRPRSAQHPSGPARPQAHRELGTERPAPKVTPDSETPADAGARGAPSRPWPTTFSGSRQAGRLRSRPRPVRNRPRRRPDRRPKPPSRTRCIKAARSSDRRGAGSDLACLKTRLGHLLRPHPRVELLPP